MSQGDKASYYQALKELNVSFDKPYRNYTTAELEKKYNDYVAAGLAPPLVTEPEVDAPDLAAPSPSPGPPPGAPSPAAAPVPPSVPAAHRNPDEMAGERQNTNIGAMEPIRTDPETGYIWYQEEVMKKGYAAPRGRRVMKYNDPGVKEEQAKSGEYTETFEVAGDRRKASEVKITLPSYQVGIYKDPRFPFRIHVYNGQTGFNLFEVEDYWGGRERVPEEVKRIYVENVLCYDIRTTVRAIETEFRRLQLAGKV